MNANKYNELRAKVARYPDGEDHLHDAIMRCGEDADERLIMVAVRRRVSNACRRARFHAPESAATTACAHSSDPDTALDVRTVLAHVSPDHRAVLVGLAVGESLTDTAERVGAPIGTIMSRRARACSAARAILNEGKGGV